MKHAKVSPRHPRAVSLRIRERLIEQFGNGVVAGAGLLAHGRGEAFDYLLGEKTTSNAIKAIRVAAALLLTAERPVISVNGNAAALAAEDLVKLAQQINAKIEVNLFHRSFDREKAIEKLLKEAGASQVLGVGEASSATIHEIASDRRRVDPRGILIADVVLIPLEDGDRTEALAKMGKKVVAIDLNPLSRTARFASVTIVDNIVRALPCLTEFVQKLRTEDNKKLRTLAIRFNNGRNLSEAMRTIEQRLERLAKEDQKGAYLTILEEQTA